MLALLVYTISLRITVNICFLHVTLSIFLHAVPLGTFCIAGVKFILDMQSPALAAVALL